MTEPDCCKEHLKMEHRVAELEKKVDLMEEKTQGSATDIAVSDEKVNSILRSLEKIETKQDEMFAKLDARVFALENKSSRVGESVISAVIAGLVVSILFWLLTGGKT